ncbi:hypothetical protein N9Y17_03910 [Gammaproteobacteria bacterium]|nr:hypothetical protein [Gammaproteobacteria bacterium]
MFEYLEELRLAGFIHHDDTWDLKTGKDAKIKQYPKKHLSIKHPHLTTKMA